MVWVSYVIPHITSFKDLLTYEPLVQPARVTAHSTPIDNFPSRTTILFKLDKSVLEREEALKG